MTPTPRTDAAETMWNDIGMMAVLSSFARQLERELADAISERDALRKTADKLEEDKECNARLCESLSTELAEWREMIDVEVGTLREELAAITCEEGELWELRQTNATMKENLVTLSHLHAKEAEKWQSAYYAERAMADRLAGELQWWGDYCGDSAPASIDLALAAWKEARSGTV